MRRMITGAQIAKIDLVKEINPNPEAPATETLNKIEIDGVVYESGGGDSLTPGTGIDIDRTDPEHPVISVDTDTIATVDYVDQSVTGLVTMDEVDDEIDDKLTDYSTTTEMNQAIADHHDDTKVDKVETTGTYMRVYGVNTLGAQTMYNMGSGVVNNGIAIRNASGQLAVADPTNDVHAATKSYVDNKCAGFVTTDTEQDIYAKKNFKSDSTDYNTSIDYLGVTSRGTLDSETSSIQLRALPNKYSTGTYENTGALVSTVPEHQYTLLIPAKQGKLATMDDIPSTANFVDLDTYQTINAGKVFSDGLSSGDGIIINSQGVSNNSTAIRNLTTGTQIQAKKKVDGSWVNTNYVLPAGDTGSTKTIATTSDLDAKLDKVTTAAPTSGYKVYGVDSNGDQTMLSASNQRWNNGIVIRTSTGQINVPDEPDNTQSATSKAYVDSKLPTTIIVNNLTDFANYATEISSNISQIYGEMAFIPCGTATNGKRYGILNMALRITLNHTATLNAGHVLFKLNDFKHRQVFYCNSVLTNTTSDPPTNAYGQCVLTFNQGYLKTGINITTTYKVLSIDSNISVSLD